MSVRNQILILLGCLLLLAKTGYDWQADADRVAESVRAAEPKTRAQEKLLQLVTQRMDTSLPDPDRADPMENRVATVMANVTRQAKNRLVLINQVSPEGTATGSVTRPVRDLVQKTSVGLPFVRVIIKGQYRSLAGLDQFLTTCVGGYVSLAAIKIDRDVFELTLDIYGSA